MQQDDMSVLVMYSIQHTPVDLVCRHTRLPVIRVNRFSDKQIIPPTCNHHRPDLLMTGGVGISVIRGAEENSALPRYAFQEHTRQFQLGKRTLVGILCHVMMGESVVSYRVSSIIDLLHKREVLLHLQSHHEESRRHTILFQRTQHRRRPVRIRSVIEGEDKLLVPASAQPLNGVCGGKFPIMFFCYQPVVLVNAHGDLPRMRF